MKNYDITDEQFADIVDPGRNLGAAERMARAPYVRRAFEVELEIHPGVPHRGWLVRFMDKNVCRTCGGKAYRPANPGTSRRAALRCNGCNHTPGRCTCPWSGPAWLVNV